MPASGSRLLPSVCSIVRVCQMIREIKKSLKAILWLTIVACVTFACLAPILRVDKEPTPQDRVITGFILDSFAPEAKQFLRSKPRNFEEEIRAIQLAQDAVLKTTPVNEGIPELHTRELADIWALRKGVCYDRSRGMEKIIIQMGFRVRHISIYALQNEGVFYTLRAKQIPSHAITEVSTSKGWLVVDSNNRWISLSKESMPIPVAEMARHPRADGYLQGPPNEIFQHPFIPVYGLYSRHGKFYPPYIAFPNMNYGDILLNFGNANPYLGLQF